MEHSELADLIDRFWSGKASSQEKRMLLDYLDRHHRELKATLESMYGQEDGSAIVESIEAYREEAWLRNIHARAGIDERDEKDEKKSLPVRSVAWVAAAALVILGLGIVWRLPLNLQADKAVVQQMAANVAPVIYRNVGKEDMRIVLPDQSTVMLSPRGELVHSAEYGVKARGIQLRGKALFSVEQHAGKPFTVYANGFATTALGTEFIVSTEEAGHTTVRLLSGKVVVTATEPSHFKMASVYLRPGDELRIDALAERLAVVNTLKEPLEKSGKPTVNPAQTDDADGLRFNRTPLGEVFRRIADLKGVIISTEKVDLGDLSFSGDLLPTDSLETILSIVCTMNDLNYRHEDDHVVIIKK